MKKYAPYIILLVTVITLIGCPGIETIPEIPEITYKSFTLTRTTDALGNDMLLGELTFMFRDGDGDIGLEAPDSIPEGDTSFFNLFFTLYEKTDGDYRMISNDDLPSPLYYRIPFMEKEGNNKTLKGDIKVEFEYLTIDYDTIRYTFFLIDRAGHKSNIDTTADIGFTEWKDKL
jgi:hypothetical protein